MPEEKSPQDAQNDEGQQKKGIPPENLTALHAFLTEKRQGQSTNAAGTVSKFDKTPVFTEEEKAKLNRLSRQKKERLLELMRSIPTVRFLKPDGAPKPEWMLFGGAGWEAAQETASAAAEEESWLSRQDNSWGRAKNAISVTTETAAYRADPSDDDVAFRTAQDAARALVTRTIGHELKVSAAFPVSKTAESAVTNEAANDAALIAAFIVVSDKQFDHKAELEAHANARWEVWRKGYALLCDVNGTLYVYAPDAPPK